MDQVLAYLAFFSFHSGNSKDTKPIQVLNIGVQIAKMSFTNSSLTRKVELFVKTKSKILYKFDENITLYSIIVHLI